MKLMLWQIDLERRERRNSLHRLRSAGETPPRLQLGLRVSAVVPGGQPTQALTHRPHQQSHGGEIHAGLQGDFRLPRPDAQAVGPAQQGLYPDDLRGLLLQRPGHRRGHRQPHHLRPRGQEDPVLGPKVVSSNCLIRMLAHSSTPLLFLGRTWARTRCSCKER